MNTGRRGVVVRGTANLPSHARIAAFAQAERGRGAFVGSTLPPSTPDDCQWPCCDCTAEDCCDGMDGLCADGD